jgi:hypothetical protein
VRVDDLRLGLSALEALRQDPAAAKRKLSELCQRHRLENVIGLLG